MRRRSTCGAALGLALAAGTARADTFHDWSQGQAALDLGSAADRFCFLTRVRGLFAGGGEQVRLWTENGRWFLGGQSQQKGVAGSATCQKRSRWLAPVGAARLSSEEVSIGFWTDGACRQLGKRGWWGDAATVLTRVQGRFRGGGEWVGVTQSGDPFAGSSIEAHTCQDDAYIGVGAYSFFVGKPGGGHQARFIGPNGAGTASQSAEYAIGPWQTAWMAAAKDAVCYLTRVGGKFTSGADEVRVDRLLDSNGTERWRLSSHYWNSDGVQARARCFAYDQSR